MSNRPKYILYGVSLYLCGRQKASRHFVGVSFEMLRELGWILFISIDLKACPQAMNVIIKQQKLMIMFVVRFQSNTL